MYQLIFFSLAPTPPIIKQITVIDSKSVHVEWNIPAGINGILRFYTITYVTESGIKKINTTFNGLQVSIRQKHFGDSISNNVHMLNLKFEICRRSIII